MSSCVIADEECTVDLPLEAVLAPTMKLVSTASPEEAIPHFHVLQEYDEEDDEPTVVEPYVCKEMVSIAETSYPLDTRPAPVPEALVRFWNEWRFQASQVREYEKIHYSDTLYQKWLRFYRRAVARMKANNAKSWVETYDVPGSLRDIFKEWRLQARRIREYEKIHYPDALYQKGLRFIDRCRMRMRQNSKKAYF